MKVSTLALALGATGALAQRPSNTSVCDYYTTALLKNNTAKNQYTVLTLLVNTAVLGNAVPKPKIDGVNFPTVNGLDGILAPNATYQGKPASLVAYFDGSLKSSNRGGSSGVSVNFLDGGGASPIESGMPASDNKSNQYKLLTHLYQFFGSLLMCSQQGMSDDFPKYGGDNGMYDVHKYMALNSSQVGYFIEQVGLAAKSFGVTDDDVTAVGKALTGLFDVRCGPETEVIPGTGKQLQSICITSDCMEAANATCSAYQTVTMPMVANGTSPASGGNGTSSGGSGSGSSGSGSGSPSAAGPSSTPASGAAATIYGSVVAAFGIAAAAFVL